MKQWHACPRCNRGVKTTGAVEIDGQTYPVFQCMECIDDWEVDGECYELALTWAVDPKGGIFLPESIDPSQGSN